MTPNEMNPSKLRKLKEYNSLMEKVILFFYFN